MNNKTIYFLLVLNYVCMAISLYIIMLFKQINLLPVIFWYALIGYLLFKKLKK